MVEEKSELRSGITAPFNKRLNEALQFNPQMPFNIGNTVTPSQLIGVLKGEQGTPGLPAAISAVKDDNNLVMLATSPIERGNLKIMTVVDAVTEPRSVQQSFLVPEGKKWILKGYRQVNTGTMTTNNSQIRIVDKNSTSFTGINQTALISQFENANLEIPSGWTVKSVINITAVTTGGDVTTFILVKEFNI